MFEADGGSKSMGIPSGDAEGVVRDIPGTDFGLRHFEGQCDGDATTACADVEDIPSCLMAGKNVFTEFRRLWAWNQDTWSYLKWSSIEFSCAQNILHWLAFLESDDDFFKFRLVV